MLVYPINSVFRGLARPFFLAVAMSACWAQTYDVAASFEQGWVTNSNPNGVWSYGYSSGFTTSVTLFDTTDVYPRYQRIWVSPAAGTGLTPDASLNYGPAYNDGNVDFLANEFLLVAGLGGQYSDLVFTAPTAGTYSIVSEFRGAQYGIGTVVGVIANGQVLFSSSVTSDGQLVPFNTQIALNAGNKVVFSVGPGGGLQNTGLAATITTVTTGLQFVSMPPCRVVDTRDSTKPAGFGPPSLPGEVTRSFSIQNGSCRVPATAQGYSLNVTVVPHTELGYLTVWPTGQNQPLVSTLNSLDGEVKANAAIVAAGSGGAISVIATDDTDVVLDISGYFVPNTVSGGLGFYPMTPCRLVDTRPGALSTIITGALPGGTSTTLPILSSSCDVPLTAQAYSLNFTLVPPGPVAYLTVYPTGESLPIVSTLNDPTGAVQANAAIAPAGSGGSIEAFVTQTTDLVVDINGYFAPVAEGALSLYALPPCRVLDTRTPPGSPPFVGTIDVNIGSNCGGTSAAQAYVFNATVVPQGFFGYLTLWPEEGGVQPVVSTLNAYDGEVTSNMAIVPTGNTGINAFASNSAYLVLDLFGYFAP
jgi:hypothetical protein